MNEITRVAKWFSGRDTGMSSMGIAAHMCGVDVSDGWNFPPPSDPADLGRCLRLLELFPEWKPRLIEMRKYKAWKGTIDKWDDISKSMKEEVGIDWSKGKKAMKTYEMMKGIRDNQN